MKPRKTRKMKKMRGGIISKNIENNWHLDAATVNKVSTPTVNRYRDLEILVLNKLAKDSVSPNSNVVLEHETILERNYRDMCETAKGDGNTANIKTLKDNIASIINLRYEEGIDRLRPQETDEERIKRENHETRLNLWKRKYTIIKKFFNEVQRALHKPRVREDTAYLTEKLHAIQTNLDSIDVVFHETIRKAKELQTDLSIYLGFEVSLPDVFHSSTVFSTSLQAFIEQKQAELISSKEVLTLKRTAIIELIARSEEEEREERVEEEREEKEEREERVEEEREERREERGEEQAKAEVVNAEATDAKEFVSPVIEQGLNKREETEEEAMEKALLLADTERAELKQRAEEERTSMDKRAETTERSKLSSIRQDRLTLEQYEKSKQVLEVSKLKLLALTDTLDELSKILKPNIVDSIYQFYGEMKNGPENKETMAVKRKLDAVLDDLRHDLSEDLRGNIDVLIKTVEEIHKTKKFFDKQSAKIAEDTPKTLEIIARVNKLTGAVSETDNPIKDEYSRIIAAMKLDEATLNEKLKEMVTSYESDIAKYDKRIQEQIAELSDTIYEILDLPQSEILGSKADGLLAKINSIKAKLNNPDNGLPALEKEKIDEIEKNIRNIRRLKNKLSKLTEQVEERFKKYKELLGGRKNKTRKARTVKR